MQTNEQKKLIQEAASYPTWILSSRQLCDLELLLNGSFAPMKTFLGREDYESVLANMRLTDNSLMPIPVVLDVSENRKTNYFTDNYVYLLKTRPWSLPIIK